jgi:hypothetical protein
MLTTTVNSVRCSVYTSAFHIKMPTKPVPRYPLGTNGPYVPALGFGLMGLAGHAYGSAPSDDETFAILDRALELGETFWDSSE